MQRKRCIERLKLNARPRRYKKAWATHRDRTRPITNKHAKAEGHVKDGICFLGGQSHAHLDMRPDRQKNELKYPKEAAELIEAWQDQSMSGQPMSGFPSEHGEVISAERQS